MEQWNETAQWSRIGKGNKQYYKVELFVVLDYAIYTL